MIMVSSDGVMPNWHLATAWANITIYGFHIMNNVLFIVLFMH